MSEMMENGEKRYTLDIPQLEGKEGYIGTFLTAYLNLITILRSPEFTREPIRVYYITEAIISLIPDQDNRQKARDTVDTTFKSLEAKYLKEHGTTKLTDAEHSHLTIVASLRTLGTVTDYIDQYVGLNTKNKVGFVRRQNKK